MTYKVNTDSRNIGFRVGVVGETKEQARLSDTGISDEEKLEEVVVSIVAWHQLTFSTQYLLEFGRIVIMLKAWGINLSRRHGG